VESKLDSSVEQRKEMAIAPNKNMNNKVIMVLKNRAKIRKMYIEQDVLKKKHSQIALQVLEFL